MKRFNLSAVLALGSVVAVSNAAWGAEKAVAAEAKPAAAETKADKAAGEAKPAEGKPSGVVVKLTKPWSDLTSLSDDQKVKIEAIHKKALAESNTIEKKEKEDIAALLTDAQKAELKELSSKKRKDATAKKVVETTEKKAESSGK